MIPHFSLDDVVHVVAERTRTGSLSAVTQYTTRVRDLLRDPVLHYVIVRTSKKGHWFWVLALPDRSMSTRGRHHLDDMRAQPHPRDEPMTYSAALMAARLL